MAKTMIILRDAYMVVPGVVIWCKVCELHNNNDSNNNNNGKREREQH